MAILLKCVSHDTRRIDFLRVDGLSTDTPGLGPHNQSHTKDLNPSLKTNPQIKNPGFAQSTRRVL